MNLFFDGNSTGFAIRDFQLLLEQQKNSLQQACKLYCDARFLNLFGATCPAMTLVAYPPRTPDQQFAARCQSLAALRNGQDLLPCGIQRPTGYLDFAAPDPLADLRPLLASGRRTLFCIVSGLKNTSEEGGDDPAARQQEGQRQTYPFAEIAKVIKAMQNAVGQRAQVIPVSVQYGDPDALLQHFAQISKDFGLNPPIYHPAHTGVLDDFSSKARFMAALCVQNHANGFPPLAVGNASTYAHLLLALADWHRCGGRLFVALDSFPGSLRAKNRAYWHDVSAGRLGGVQVMAQPDDAPGQWAGVTAQIAAAAAAEIQKFV